MFIADFLNYQQFSMLSELIVDIVPVDSLDLSRPVELASVGFSVCVFFFLCPRPLVSAC